MSIEHKPLFRITETPSGVAVAKQNFSGSLNNTEDLIPNAKQPIKKYIRDHYGPRGGTHDPEAKTIGFVIRNDTNNKERMADHAKYRIKQNSTGGIE